MTQYPPSSASLTWDTRNQLSSYNGITFSYDAFGRRYTANWSGGTTNYLYDGAAVIQASSPGELDTYMRIGNEVLAWTKTVNGQMSKYIPVHDWLGSTVAMIFDQPINGPELMTTYSYEPFGNPTILAGTNTGFPFLFAGMEYNSATGLYHLLSRYYGPQIGRFLPEDPLGVGGGDINLFTYVANNPVNAIDPLGQDCPNGDCSYTPPTALNILDRGARG